MNKYRSIATDIRDDIISGLWKPGDRLPTHVELRSRYNTTIATVQKAMVELQQEKFIASYGKSGTFVTDQPPHLFNYAVVFPTAPDDFSSWDTLWANFVNQQREMEEHFKCKLAFYYLEQGNPECREFRRLVVDAEYGRLAGIIFPDLPHDYLLPPLVASRTPCVVVTRDMLPSVNTVWVDYTGFFRQAFDLLHANGRKRIAVLSEVRMPREYIEELCRHAKKKGTPIPSEFQLGFRLEPLSMPWLDSLIELLFRGGPAERPDGLILANENFRDHVLHVLQQKKLIPGKDVEIVLHTNFPAAGPNPFPINRLGFKVEGIMEACLDTLVKYRQSGIVDHSALVPVSQEK